MSNLSTIFDATPLQTWHGYLFLGVFALVWLLLWRTTHHVDETSDSPPYEGIILIGVMATAAFAVLWPSPLAYGVGIAAILTALVGRTDEIDTLSPLSQLIWQILIAVVLVACGWTILYVSQPFGDGILHLDLLQWRTLVFPGSILTIIWFVFLMNTINWIDGIDGLATSIATIATVTLIGMSLLPSTQDGQTLTLGIIGLAGFAGFLVWNFPPARVYLGTTGSWFVGLYLGIIAMVGEGKIITTLLVLALPILDALFVILHRLIHKQAPWQGDRVSHLHHRLLAAGHSPRSITIAAIIVSITFAAVALLAPTESKMIVFAVITAGFLLSLFRAILRQRVISS